MTQRMASCSLIEAINSGNLRAVQELLAHGAVQPLIHQRDAQLNTPLILAASKGLLGVLTLLLQHKADINAQNSSGHTALTRACASGSRSQMLEVAQLLVGAPSVDFNVADSQGNTALIWAAKVGSKELAQLLLDSGGAAQLNALDTQGRSPLVHACMAGAASVVALLLQVSAAAGGMDRHQSEVNTCASSSEEVRQVIADHNRRQRQLTASASPSSLLPGSLSHLSDGGAPNSSNQLQLSIRHPATGSASISSVSLLEASRVNYSDLFAAIQQGKQAEVRQILDDPSIDVRAVLDQRDQRGNTSLHMAAAKGHTAILHSLLQRASANRLAADVANNDGFAPLSLAALHGHLACAKLLLAAGAAADFVGNNTHVTPLLLASAQGHASLATALLEAGADVNATDVHGATPLFEASEQGHTQVLEVLMSCGGVVDAAKDDGSTPLLAAVRSNRPEVVASLLAGGADVNRADQHGDTPLIEAATSGGTALVTALLSHKADVNARNQSGETALMRASVQISAGAVDELLAAGAKVDTMDAELGFTPLMFAASQGSAQVVTSLLSAGASVGYANSSGITALLLAARSGYSAVVAALLRAGAAVDRGDSKGYTPLMVASVGGFPAVVETLIKAGAAPQARNYEGYTALSAASEYGQHEVVDLLVRLGAGSGDLEADLAAPAGQLVGQAGRPRNGLGARAASSSGTDPASGGAPGPPSSGGPAPGDLAPALVRGGRRRRPSGVEHTWGDARPVGGASRLSLEGLATPSPGILRTASESAAPRHSNLRSILRTSSDATVGVPGSLVDSETDCVSSSAPSRPDFSVGSGGGTGSGGASSMGSRSNALLSAMRGRSGMMTHGSALSTRAISLHHLREALQRSNGGCSGEDVLMIGSERASDPSAIYPGCICRSPFAALVRFRDPTDGDITLYEPSEADDEAPDSLEAEEMGCFLSWGRGLQPMEDSGSDKGSGASAADQGSRSRGCAVC